MLFIGIDPGHSGGMAVLEQGNNSLDSKISAFRDMTVGDIADYLAKLPIGPFGSFAVLEAVHSMPKQGVASSFKFGRHFGFLEGILAGTRIVYELVPPQKWQKAMGCLSRGNKNVTKAAAQRLFPSVKVTHAIADALLLAEYARRTWKIRESPHG